MDTPALWETFQTVVLKSTVQAAVPAVLVLAAQGVLHGRLSPRWRAALWWLVLARLPLPVSVDTPASLCPSCYPDCQKQAQTDAEGRFTLQALNSKLVFRLLVVAGGHEARFVSRVDPAAGPVEITLAPLDEAALKSKSRITGQVLGPDGAPVVGAVISPEGTQRGQVTRWGGNDDVVDPIAVADDHGRFFLRCAEGVSLVHAKADGRGVAKRWVALRPGHDHLIRMEEGVTVTGRVLQGDKPLSEVTVALATVERACGVFLHEFEAATDARGWFIIPNVTPRHEYYCFAKMDSLQARGALPLRIVRAGATGSTVKLGDLKVRPAHRVAGRIILSDGEKVPSHTRLLLGRHLAWDHTETVLDEQGRFEFLGVPTESVVLSARLPGYRFATNNPSLDWANGCIVGRVERDLDNLVLLMEPGEQCFTRHEDMPPGVDRQPRDKPLRGVPLPR